MKYKKYLIITDTVIEKLKDKISSEQIKNLERRKNFRLKVAKFNNTLMSLGFIPEEITLIINNCEIVNVTETEIKPVQIEPKKLNKDCLMITSKTIKKLKKKISIDKIKHLKRRRNIWFEETKFRKKLKYLGFIPEEITLIINNCETFPKENDIFNKPDINNKEDYEKEIKIIRKKSEPKRLYWYKIAQNIKIEPYKIFPTIQNKKQEEKKDNVVFPHYSHLPEIYKIFPRANYKDDT